MFKYNITDTKHNYPANEKHTVDYTFSFEFKTREEYLAFRKGWKEEYLVLSNEIREAKRDLSNEMRSQAKDNCEYYSVWKQQGNKLKLQVKAQMMMQLVEASKREANYQQRQQHSLKLEEAS